MKAITIKQPWVYAILHEGKDIENRSWQTKYRGWLAIHAAASPRRGELLPARCKNPDIDSLPLSAICGIVRLVDVVTKSRSRWMDGPEPGEINYGWVLGDVTPLPEPVPCIGKLSLWTVPLAVLRKIQKQVPHLELPRD